MLEKFKIRNLTVFDELETDLVPGINIFVGANGTGKTHLLKILYTFDSTEITGQNFSEFTKKLSGVFLPYNKNLTRLVHHGNHGKKTFFLISVNDELTFSINKDSSVSCSPSGTEKKRNKNSVYIPSKEMLVNAPGFRSLYNERETHFEEIYADIIDKAFLPPLRNIDPELTSIMNFIQTAVKGEVIAKNEEFFLVTRHGETEFTLVAEGIRKLALLWLLIRNGSLGKGSALFWDEPETNLNPSMIPLIVEVLLELERIGTQIFIATHSYVLCKEFELQRKAHHLRYYSLYMKDTEDISLTSCDTYHTLSPNQIADQFAKMYGTEIERAFGVKNG